MTDDTDNDDINPTNVSAGTVTATVPGDAEWELTIQVPFDDGEQHDLTSAIVVAVAETEGVSPIEIEDPPLYEVLDVDALETAFFGSDETVQDADGLRTVEFMYRGHRVVVRSDGWVQVFDAEEA